MQVLIHFIHVQVQNVLLFLFINDWFSFLAIKLTDDYSSLHVLFSYAQNIQVLYKLNCCNQESESTDEDESGAVPAPARHYDDEKYMHISEQTDREFVQNFLTGDFCVHGVSVISS